MKIRRLTDAFPLVNIGATAKSNESRLLNTLKESRKQAPSKSHAGFTLLEISVTVLIIGILSALIAPSWLSFTNRQRVNAANDAVFRVLQEAQRQAKNKKLSYSVSFLSQQNQVPQVAIYSATDPIPTTSTDSRWTNLGGGIGLKPGQILLYTNIDAANKVISPNTITLADNASNPKTITFNYTGALPPDSDLGSSSGLKVVVASPSGMKQCVIIRTLIGGMQTAKDNDCN